MSSACVNHTDDSIIPSIAGTLQQQVRFISYYIHRKIWSISHGCSCPRANSKCQLHPWSHYNTNNKHIHHGNVFGYSSDISVDKILREIYNKHVHNGIFNLAQSWLSMMCHWYKFQVIPSLTFLFATVQIYKIAIRTANRSTLLRGSYFCLIHVTLLVLSNFCCQIDHHLFVDGLCELWAIVHNLTTI